MRNRLGYIGGSLAGAALAIAVFAISSVAQYRIPTDEGGESGSDATIVTTVSGTSTYATPAMYTLLAKQFSVILSSTTSAGRCSLAVFEVSNDSTNWTPAASWNGMLAVADSVANKRLDQGGVSASLIPYKTSATASAYPFIHYKWARFKATAYGAQALVLAIEAVAIYDEGARPISLRSVSP